MITQHTRLEADESAVELFSARPAPQSGKHPAVVIFPDAAGLTEDVIRLTELTAGLGYLAAAVDYAADGVSEVSEARIRSVIGAALDWLEAQPEVDSGRIAVWGFGNGANVAFVGSADSRIGAALCFCPDSLARPNPHDGKAPIDSAPLVSASLLLCLGEKDTHIEPVELERIREALRQAGIAYDLQTYPEVGYSFFLAGRKAAIAEGRAYSDQSLAEAEADAWNSAALFLRQTFASHTKPMNL